MNVHFCWTARKMADKIRMKAVDSWWMVGGSTHEQSLGGSQLVLLHPWSQLYGVFGWMGEDQVLLWACKGYIQQID